MSGIRVPEIKDRKAVWKNRLVTLLCQMARKIPGCFRVAFIATIARIAWLLDRRGRHISYKNLTLAYPDQNRKQHRKLARKSYINAAYSGSDLLWLDRITPRIHNLHILDEARESGKGVCLLTLHLGSWEVLPLSLRQANYPVTVLTNIPKSFNFLHECYKKADIPYICRKTPSTLVELVKACKKGEIICFFSDQFEKEVDVTLFGINTQAPAGGISLAMMMKASTVIGWSWKDNHGNHHVSFESFEIKTTGERNRDMQYNMQRAIDRFEELIRKHPEQWLWSYNRFKNVKFPHQNK